MFHLSSLHPSNHKADSPAKFEWAFLWLGFWPFCLPFLSRVNEDDICHRNPIHVGEQHTDRRWTKSTMRFEAVKSWITFPREFFCRNNCKCNVKKKTLWCWTLAWNQSAQNCSPSRKSRSNLFVIAVVLVTFPVALPVGMPLAISPRIHSLLNWKNTREPSYNAVVVALDHIRPI